MRDPALGSCGLRGCPVILKDLLAQPFQLSVKIIEPDSLHRLCLACLFSKRHTAKEHRAAQWITAGKTRLAIATLRTR